MMRCFATSFFPENALVVVISSKLGGSDILVHDANNEFQEVLTFDDFRKFKLKIFLFYPIFQIAPAPNRRAERDRAVRRAADA